MARARNRPALVAHGGAGNAGPGAERPERRRAMMAAMRLGAGILRAKGSALEAVVATVAALEDHPLFNAGYGSLLNSEGNVEMDASVMVAEPVPFRLAQVTANALLELIPTKPITVSLPALLPWSAACEIRSCSRVR